MRELSVTGENHGLLREEVGECGSTASLVCTMEGADGRTLGTLTMEVGPAEAYPSEEGVALLREGAALLAGAMPPSVVTVAPPARREERPREAPPAVKVRSVLIADGLVLDEQDFSFPISDGLLVASTPALPLSKQVASYERRLIESALRGTHGNRARAARILQTTERILGYRIQQYGIDCGQYRRSGQ